jgi:hypothetical protein
MVSGVNKSTLRLGPILVKATPFLLMGVATLCILSATPIGYLAAAFLMVVSTIVVIVLHKTHAFPLGKGETISDLFQNATQKINSTKDNVNLTEDSEGNEKSESLFAKEEDIEEDISLDTVKKNDDRSTSVYFINDTDIITEEEIEKMKNENLKSLHEKTLYRRIINKKMPRVSISAGDLEVLDKCRAMLEEIHNNLGNSSGSIKTGIRYGITTIEAVQIAMVNLHIFIEMEKIFLIKNIKHVTDGCTINICFEDGFGKILDEKFIYLMKNFGNDIIIHPESIIGTDNYQKIIPFACCNFFVSIYTTMVRIFKEKMVDESKFREFACEAFDHATACMEGMTENMLKATTPFVAVYKDDMTKYEWAQMAWNDLYYKHREYYKGNGEMPSKDDMVKKFKKILAMREMKSREGPITVGDFPDLIEHLEKDKLIQ